MLPYTTMYQKSVLETGLETEKSTILELKEDIEDIGFQTQQKTNNSKISFTPEYPLKSKKTNLNIKSNTFNQSIPSLSSLRTLDLDLITTEEDSKLSWTDSLTMKYDKLWLPTKTDSLDLDSSSFNGSLKHMKHHSSVIMNTQLDPMRSYQVTLSQSLLSSVLDTMGHESTKETQLSTRKIPFKPTHRQKELFKHCFGTTRYLYNECITEINKEIDISSSKMCNEYSHITLRNNYMKKNKELPLNLKWQNNIPFDTRALVYKAISSHIKSCNTHLKNKNISSYRFKYKRRKDTKQVFYCSGTALKLDSLRLFPKILDNGKRLKPHEYSESRLNINKRNKTWIRNNIKKMKDFSIVKEHDKYYICIPHEKEVIKKTKKRVVAIDPGVRSFVTWYSDCGIAGDNGTNITPLLASYHERIRTLLLRLNCNDDIVSRTRKNIKKRILWLRSRIRNIVTDLHRQVSNFLCSTFSDILLPKFMVKGMIKKQNRTIRKSVVKGMISLRHCDFRTYIQHVAIRWGCKVHICEERYTSKTCTRCGVKTDVGGSKVFNCNNCGLVIDRDYGASRNIWVKNISMVC